MGCGASKSVAVANMPSQPIVAAPTTTIVAVQQKQEKGVEAPAVLIPEVPLMEVVEAVVAVAEPVPVAPLDDDTNELESILNKPVLAPIKPVEIRPMDSGCESNDELAKDKESISSALDLTTVGKRASRIRSAISAASDASHLADTESDSNSFEAIPAPTIAERPSSRGGLAFDMTFEGDQARARVPARLEKIRTRTRSSEMSIEELQAKLAAADSRRQSVEQKLKEKMSKEVEKTGKVQQQLTQNLEGMKKTEVVEKENKVLENREANLRSIREKLKAREEHARKVRENKRLSGSVADLSAAQPLPVS